MCFYFFLSFFFVFAHYYYLKHLILSVVHPLKDPQLNTDTLKHSQPFFLVKSTGLSLLLKNDHIWIELKSNDQMTLSVWCNVEVFMVFLVNPSGVSSFTYQISHKGSHHWKAVRRKTTQWTRKQSYSFSFRCMTHSLSSLSDLSTGSLLCLSFIVTLSLSTFKIEITPVN